MERKNIPNLALKVKDKDLGIVEHIFAVFGNVDSGYDVLHPGSFTKTLNENGTRVKVLDHHNSYSIMDAIGVPIEIREISREDLPAEILAEFPDAKGGVLARTQFLMDTPEGKGAFLRIKEGAISEWSFGYDATKVDYETIEGKDGEEDVNIRHLREVKLYEYSPVLWGMNPATSTIDAKNEDKKEDKEEQTLEERLFELEKEFDEYRAFMTKEISQIMDILQTKMSNLALENSQAADNEPVEETNDEKAEPDGSPLTFDPTDLLRQVNLEILEMEQNGG